MNNYWETTGTICVISLAGAHGSRTHRRHGQCPPTDLKSVKPTGTHPLPLKAAPSISYRGRSSQHRIIGRALSDGPPRDTRAASVAGGWVSVSMLSGVVAGPSRRLGSPMSQPVGASCRRCGRARCSFRRGPSMERPSGSD